MSNPETDRENLSPGMNRMGWFWAIVLVLCLGMTVFFFTRLAQFPVLRVWRAAEFPHQLDAEEGFLLGQALRLKQGQGLYPSIAEPPHVVDNYPPLYPAIWSLAARWGGDSLAAGRWIAAAAAAATALAIGFFILVHGLPREWTERFFRRKEKDGNGRPDKTTVSSRPENWLLAVNAALLAWVCPLMFLTAYEVLRWMAYSRVDFLAVAFSAWGLAVFALWGTREKRGFAIHTAAVFLFALALMSKQTSVAAPAACAIWLALRDRRGLVRFAPAMVLAAGIPILALSAKTGGRYWLHTVAYNRNVMNWNELIWQARHLWRFYMFALAVLAVLAVWTVMRLTRGGKSKANGAAEDPVLTLSFFYLAVNALSLVTLAKAGAAENYLIEPICAAAIFLGVALNALFKIWLANPERWKTGALLTVMLGVLLLHAVRYAGSGRYTPYHGRLAYYSAPSPTVQAFVQGNKVVEEMKKRPGPVLTEDPVYALRAGKPVLFQNFIMTQLTAEGKWDERPFVERVRAKDFSLIAAHKDLEDDNQFFNRWSPALRAAIERNYKLLEKLDRAPPLQTIYLYVPESEPK